MLWPLGSSRLVRVRWREGFVITTIAVQFTEDGINLGWDSKVSPDGTHPEKVKQVNGQFWLGIAGYTRHADILHYAEVPGVHPSELAGENFDARRYLVTEVVPAWLDAMKSSHDPDPDTREDWPKGQALIVIAGRVFTTDHLFSITEHVQNTAIGSGGDFALGALAAGKSLKKAMEIACSLDPGTDGPTYELRGL